MKTDQIEKAIEQIRLLPNAHVDCGTGQGRDRFFAQLVNHASTPEMLELPFEWHVTEADKCLTQIETLVKPHSLPDDYVAFLKRHGGFTISNEGCDFASLGLGPMAEEWYPYLAGRVGYYESGFLKIGTLRLRDPYENKFMYVWFLLDLGGGIQRCSVTGLSMWKLGRLSLQDALREPQSCSFCWSLIAGSFAEWLQTAAATEGRFGYL